MHLSLNIGGLLCLAFLVPGVAQAGTLYVSPTGNDANTGASLKQALRTPQRAADRANPGDTVLFATGKYEAAVGQGVLVITRSGEPGKPITFAPAPGQQPTLRSRGAWQVIKIQGASYIVVRGLRLRGNTDDIKIEEARREMNNLLNPRTCGNGLMISDDRAKKAFPSHITVQDCDIRDFPGGGLGAVHADSLTFENNVVARCGFWSPYACSGISIYQPIDQDKETGYKLIIRGNVSFENNNYIPFYYSNKDNPEKRTITDGNGIILDDFHNSQGFGGGASKPYGGKTLVANNVVFDNGGSGIHVFHSAGVDIVYNYAANNNQNPEQRSGQIFSNSSERIRILNNILIAPAGKPVNSDYKNGEDVVYNYNLYSVAGGAAPEYARPLANNRVAHPGLTLIDWAKGERRLNAAPQSPLRKAGTPFPEAGMDFFGRRRNKERPDVGPFVL